MKGVLLFFGIFFCCQFIYAQEIRSFGNRSILVHETGDVKNANKNKRECFSELNPNLISTGILYDRVAGISQIENFTGQIGSKKSNIGTVRQIYSELNRSRNKALEINEISSLETSYKGKNVIPIVVLDYQYEKIKENALKNGLIEVAGGKYLKNNQTSESPFDVKNVFVGASLKNSVYHGRIAFRINKESYLTNIEESIQKIEIDFDDNEGWRNINMDEDIDVNYNMKGDKNISIRVTDAKGVLKNTSFTLHVASLTMPEYEDVPLVADIPFEGVYASGNAYVFKSPMNDVVKNPIIIAEGFDLNNEMFAEELYSLFNQQNVASCLLKNGYDLIIVNYTESKTYIQANAMLFVKVMQYVNQNLKANINGNAVIGASMGGLVARYGLSYMEKHNIPHETRLFAAFDSPNKGANIPLGDQLWINFFANQNDAAAVKIDQINSIAAQQMLVYHHLTYPADNPYRTAFVADLAAMGYPQQPRLMAVANGTASGSNQGYKAGDQTIDWRYRSWDVDIDGNVWAVPNMEPLTTIVDCNTDKIWPLPDQSLQIQVRGTLPYDNAPGGYRDSNQEIADTDTGYGKINTNNPNHCFIPTISSLDINTDDLFYPIANDSTIQSKTPFNAVYFSKTYHPDVNQMHMFISPEAANWIFNELRPITVNLNGKTRNKGEVVAQKNVKILPGFHAGSDSGFHSTTYTFTSCASIEQDSSQVAISSTVSSNESKQASSINSVQITAYPNPNDGNFTVSFSEQEEAEIEIYDMMGNCVYKTSFQSSTSNINISNCENGLYMVKIKAGDKREIKKIVINR